MNDIDEFVEILVALYVVVIALMVVLTRLEGTLHDHPRPRSAFRRSKLAPADAESAERGRRSRPHVDG